MNKRDIIERDLDELYLDIRMAKKASNDFQLAMAKLGLTPDADMLSELMDDTLHDHEKQKDALEMERAVIHDAELWSDYYGSVM